MRRRAIQPAWVDREATPIVGIEPGPEGEGRRMMKEAMFYPTYELLDRPRTPVGALRRARDIGVEEGLWYVYDGNVPGEGGEHTYCHSCGAVPIERYGLELIRDRLQDGTCPECGTAIDGVGM